MTPPPEPPASAPRRYARRRALRLAGAAAGGALGTAFLAACGGSPAASEPTAAATAVPTATPPPPTPSPTPTPRPVPPAGRIERTLLPDTDWATPAVLTHSGIEGPRVVVLGGVHGNEPGGWIAAQEIAGWTVRTGSLVVVPQANIVADRALERTLPELGDLNRLYPGSTAPDALPMARMAAAIVALAREVDADLLIDMHESWGFYNERTAGQTGTAFIGQTVSEGGGIEALPSIESVVDAVNRQITAREQLTLRSGVGSRASWARVGTSSLSLQQWVPGLVPVLVEMGQINQPVVRRAALHQIVVHTALTQRGML
jgi:hypothetical protein